MLVPPAIVEYPRGTSLTFSFEEATFREARDFEKVGAVLIWILRLGFVSLALVSFLIPAFSFVLIPFVFGVFYLPVPFLSEWLWVWAKPIHGATKSNLVSPILTRSGFFPYLGLLAFWWPLDYLEFQLAESDYRLVGWRLLSNNRRVNFIYITGSISSVIPTLWLCDLVLTGLSGKTFIPFSHILMGIGLLLFWATIEAGFLTLKSLNSRFLAQGNRLRLKLKD